MNLILSHRVVTELKATLKWNLWFCGLALLYFLISVNVYKQPITLTTIEATSTTEILAEIKSMMENERERREFLTVQALKKSKGE